MATFTEELLDQLKSDILHGNVVIDRDWQPYAEAISSRFPFVGSKIAWEKVPRSVQEIQSPEGGLEELVAFMRRQFVSHGITEDVSVALIGDAAVDVVLLTTVGFLELLAGRVFGIPQHLYIAPLNGSWCLVFSMGGDMCFACAPPSN